MRCNNNRKPLIDYAIFKNYFLLRAWQLGEDYLGIHRPFTTIRSTTVIVISNKKTWLSVIVFYEGFFRFERAFWGFVTKGKLVMDFKGIN
jgi:hypothetical protein